MNEGLTRRVGKTAVTVELLKAFPDAVVFSHTVGTKQTLVEKFNVPEDRIIVPKEPDRKVDTARYE